MNGDVALPVLVLASSFMTGLVIFFLAEEQQRLRSVLNVAGALVKIGLVGLMLVGVYGEGRMFEARGRILPGIEIVLRADELSLLFMTLSAILWLLTTIYAIGYLEGSPHRSRFFGFFSLCVMASMGIALAGNLFTFFVFYELLTLSTWPLVVHRGSEGAMRAGNVYLAYLLGGGAVLLVGVIWMHGIAGTIDFREGGFLGGVGAGEGELALVFLLLIAGIGVKAAIVPFHGWLPVAMAAPAPVSALLHAVAVVKAGAFGIVRVTFDVYGIEFAAGLGLLAPLAVVACVTIVWGSLRALAQTDLKRRLAFSTVSQVSYIVLGASLFGPLATIGGLVHLVHQGLMKITLFFCAGNLAETLGISRVDQMQGVGRRMPWTMAAFTVAAFGMIGLPPFAGFISKWYLGLGAHEAGMDWVLAVLALSSALNAAYFLPIVYRAWFRGADRHWPERTSRLECDWRLLMPTVACGFFVIAAGLLAGLTFSPLDWAVFIAAREYLE